MTVKQAQNINEVFASQKAEIAFLKTQLDSTQSAFTLQDSLWANLSKETSKQTIELLNSISHNQQTIIELENKNQKLKKNLARKNDQFFGITVGYFMLRWAYFQGLFEF